MKQVEIGLTFPELLLLDDYGGNFNLYLKAAYNIFENDFIRNKPIFRSKQISVKKYPEAEGMHQTFYHITHEGADSNDRQPNLRRLERVAFPKFMIDNSYHPDILIWRNSRGNDVRTIIFNTDESYIVVLSDRGGYWLLITAYFIEKRHRREKLLKEYEAFKKADTAQ